MRCVCTSENKSVGTNTQVKRKRKRQRKNCKTYGASIKTLEEKAFRYAERAPVVGYSGWQRELKEKAILDLVLFYRISEAKRCVNQEKATEYEAFAYLFTASLAAPFGSEWFRIYFYLFNKFYGHLLKNNFIERVETLTEYERHLLDDLRGWIYKKQVAHMKTQKNENSKKV